MSWDWQVFCKNTLDGEVIAHPHAAYKPVFGLSVERGLLTPV